MNIFYLTYRFSMVHFHEESELAHNKIKIMNREKFLFSKVIGPFNFIWVCDQ